MTRGIYIDTNDVDERHNCRRGKPQFRKKMANIGGSNKMLKDGDNDNLQESNATHSDRMMEVLFRVAYEITSTTGKSSSFFGLLVLLLEAFQSAGYIIMPAADFPWNPKLIEWITPMSYLTLDVVADNPARHFLGIIFFASIGVGVIASAVWVNYLVRRGQSQHESKPAPLRFLHLMVTIMPTLLLIPALNSFLKVLPCSTPLVKQVLGCGSATHIAVLVLVMLFALIFIAICLIFETMCFPFEPTSKAMNARSSGRYHMIKMIGKIVMVASFAAIIGTNDPDKNGQRRNLGLVLLVVTQVDAFAFMAYVPYYNFRTVLIGGALNWVRAWFSQSIVLFMLFEVFGQAGTTVMAYLSAPLILASGLGLSVQRRAQLILQPVELLPSPSQFELKARFLMFDLDRKLADLRRDTRDANLLEKQIEELRAEHAGQMGELLQRGLEQFPESLEMKCTAVLYYVCVLKNDARAQSTLMRAHMARSGSVNFIFKFRLYRLQRLLQVQKGTSQGTDDVLSRMQLRKACSEAESLISQALAQQQKFWMMLLDEDPDLESLQEVGSSIALTIEKTHALLEVLVREHANDIVLMKARARFHMYVLSDMLTGAKLMEQADNLEKHQKAALAMTRSGTDHTEDTRNVLVVSAADHQLGVVQEATPEALKILGRTRESLVGQNISVILPQAVAAHHDQLVSRFASMGSGDNVVGLTRDLFAIEDVYKRLIMLRVNLSLVPSVDNKEINVVVSMWPFNTDSIVAYIRSDTSEIIHESSAFAELFYGDVDDAHAPSAQTQEASPAAGRNQHLFRKFMPDWAELFDDCHEEGGATAVCIDINDELVDMKVTAKELMTRGYSLVTLDPILQEEIEDNSSQIEPSQSSYIGRSISETPQSRKVVSELRRRRNSTFGVGNDLISEISENESSYSSGSSSVGSSAASEWSSNAGGNEPDLEDPKQSPASSEQPGRIEQEEQAPSKVEDAVSPANVSVSFQPTHQEEEEEKSDNLSTGANRSDADGSSDDGHDAIAAGLMSLARPGLPRQNTGLRNQNADDDDDVDDHASDGEKSSVSNMSGASSESSVAAIRRRMLTNRNRVDRSVLLLILVLAFMVILVTAMSIFQYRVILDLIDYYEANVSSMLSSTSLQKDLIGIAYIIESVALANAGYRPVELSEPMFVHLAPIVDRFESRFSTLFLSEQKARDSQILKSLEGDPVYVLESGHERSVSIHSAVQTFVTHSKKLTSPGMVVHASDDVRFILDNMRVLILAMDHISRLYWFDTDEALNRLLLQSRMYLGSLVFIVTCVQSIAFWPRLKYVHKTKRDVLDLFRRIPRAAVFSMLNRVRTASTGETAKDDIVTDLVVSTGTRRRRRTRSLMRLFVKLSAFVALTIMYALSLVVTQKSLVEDSASVSTELFMSGQRHHQLREASYYMQQVTAAYNLTEVDLTSMIKRSRDAMHYMGAAHRALLFGGSITAEQHNAWAGVTGEVSEKFIPNTKLTIRSRTFAGAVKRYKDREILVFGEGACGLFEIHGTWNQYGAQDTISEGYCKTMDDMVFAKGLHRSVIILELVFRRVIHMAELAEMPRTQAQAQMAFWNGNVLLFEQMMTGGMRFGLDAASELYREEQNARLVTHKRLIDLQLAAYVFVMICLVAFVFVPTMAQLNSEIARVRFMLLLVPMNVLKDVKGIREFFAKMVIA